MPIESAKGQPAFEFLITYGWAVLVVALVLGSAIYFVTLPNSVQQQHCTFQSSVYCENLVADSNSISTKISMLLVNSQQFLVLTPKVKVSLGAIGTTASAACTPTSINPGNSMTCNAVIATPSAIGSSIYGTIYLNYTACPSNSASNCQPPLIQSFVGNFSTRVVPGN